MIDLYTWSTPNGRKVSIMLEETGLDYRVKPVNIGQGEQFAPEFLKISPNNRIPAIVDHAGPKGQAFALFESGAILLYLAYKSGKLLPGDPAQQFKVMQWLMFQMGGIGPMFGQAHHFLRAAPQPVPYAIERYTQETRRLYKVLDHQLEDQEFIAGDYSIADIATYPWIARHEWHQVALADFPSVQRWFAVMGARPAVQQGMAKP
ncbi:MAG: glutathione S-transferase family protein [Betaproteobacteria bacterium]|nr:glutathione S-transferase family protein [Betaproteobacteria bacterium]NDE41401.1 glutathione S-transferase family protein [Betaproteobacteria bacterium]NDE73228.1 glutathione S-transferase family protein [Betaproteobacteria bacterium]